MGKDVVEKSGKKKRKTRLQEEDKRARKGGAKRGRTEDVQEKDKMDEKRGKER